MSGQRHRIRRQVLEVVLQDQGSAWQLQTELGRIQRESLEAIVDRCCTEAGDPERLHRIESLEVDLGRIHPDNLEHELIEKLGPRLREALAARIRAEDEATSQAGADPETTSRLELVSFFARTGHLPWWADASKPRLLSETVGLLLKRAAKPLVALVRTLARDLRQLRRLVRHCEEERLWALFTALAASAPPGLAQRPAELRALLAPTWAPRSAITGIMPDAFRSAVWVAVLRAVSIEENAGEDAVSFWRGTLAHAALELGVSHTFLVTQLHEAREPRPAERPDAAFAIVRSLYREVRGETVAIDSGPQESDLSGEAASASLPAEVLGEAQRLLREALQEQSGDTSVDDSAPEDADSGAPENADSDAPENADSGAPENADSSPPSDGAAGDVEAILDRLERAGVRPRVLLRKLRAMARRSPARSRIPWFDALSDLEQRAILHGPGAPETASSLVRLLHRVIVSRWLPRRALLRVLEEVESSALVGLPAESLGEAQRSLREAIEEHRAAASPHDTDAKTANRGASATGSDAPTPDNDTIVASTAEEIATTAKEVSATAEGPAATANERPAAAEGTVATTNEASATAEGTVAAGKQGPAPANEDPAPPAEDAARFADEVESLLDRLERSGLPLRALFAELRTLARRAAAQRSGAARRPAHSPPPDSLFYFPASVLDGLKDLDQQTRTHGPSTPETASSVLRLLQSVIASRRIGASALERALGELERAPAAHPAAPPLGEAQRLLRAATSADHTKHPSDSPPLDLAYGESENVYVENAGLVILWPFLGHLFERLELMADKRFKDRSARHRAVGLLQHLVTEDPSPPEYQVTLARVLCGMDMKEVFDFGPPVTEAEAEECSNLLAAVIANAPVLKEMSIAGFRGSFLLRKGALGTRDGSWLLCVERVTYDAVLDRFPWGMSWVKLPWMEAPLSVEW